MTTTNFWLIRHGETQWNADRRLQGWRDIDLNDVGMQQAEQLAEHLSSANFTARIDHVVSSDLARAHQTATVSAHHFGVPITTTPTLRERNYGIYEGHPLTVVQGRRAGLKDFNLRDPHAPIQDGETLTVFAQRIKGAFEDLAVAYPGRNVMVFAHGGVIDIVWRLTQQLDLEAFRAEAIVNASINEFSVDARQQWQMTRWGQTKHLETDALDDVFR